MSRINSNNLFTQHYNQRYFLNYRFLIFLVLFTLTGCFDSSSNKDLSPIADAGINQKVPEQTIAILDGSGTAMEGQISGISWQQTGGENVALSDNTAPNATFVTPVTTSEITLTFTITVTDNNNRTASDSMSITVLPVNAPPEADAGADQNVLGGEQVIMQSASTDTDGTIETYAWLQTAGPTVTLIGADTAAANFTAPQFETITELAFQLMVTDNEGASATDTVTYTIGSKFSLADGINGGRLYSKFWADETGFNLTNSNLQDQTELDGISGKSNFFRCKQCHGWDRLGREGGYSNRAPKTSRPNISPIDLAEHSAEHEIEDLFNDIKFGSAPRRDVIADLSTYDPATNPTVGDQMPKYSQILTDDQIWDIVKFLKEEAYDTTLLYDITLGNGVYPNRDRTFSNIGKDGDAIHGDILYTDNCKICHGANGTAFMVDEGEFTVGRFIRSKPYEGQHKIKFGSLGDGMPAHPDFTTNDAKDLLKALTNTEKYPDIQTQFNSADGINGGRLYSQFWATETSFTLENSNLNNQAELDGITSRSNFFRCKQCHGWDRLGREGGYSNRAPKTSRPNISPINLDALVKLETNAEIFDAIKNGDGTRRDINVDLSTYDPDTNAIVGDQMPNYSQILTDAQIWDIVNYLKNEALDTTQLYDITLDDGVYPNRNRTFSNIGKDGNADNGDISFDKNCASCHGSDGTAFLVDENEFTVGSFIRNKPYEAQHKAKFGSLGDGMPAHPNFTVNDVKDILKALTDVSIYPNPVDGAALFVSKCGSCHTGNGLGTGTIKDITNHGVDQINLAISTVPVMAEFSTLTPQEIQAIADALVL